MNKQNVKKLALLGLLLAVASSARAVGTVTDFSSEVTAATTAISGILTVVAGTAVFFVGLRIFKWVAKR